MCDLACWVEMGQPHLPVFSGVAMRSKTGQSGQVGGMRERRVQREFVVGTCWLGRAQGHARASKALKCAPACTQLKDDCP